VQYWTLLEKFRQEHGGGHQGDAHGATAARREFSSAPLLLSRQWEPACPLVCARAPRVAVRVLRCSLFLPPYPL
jgi:hypothetical protein